MIPQDRRALRAEHGVQRTGTVDRRIKRGPDEQGRARSRVAGSSANATPGRNLTAGIGPGGGK
jgi:hypothetical protein